MSKITIEEIQGIPGELGEVSVILLYGKKTLCLQYFVEKRFEWIHWEIEKSNGYSELMSLNLPKHMWQIIDGVARDFALGKPIVGLPYRIPYNADRHREACRLRLKKLIEQNPRELDPERPQGKPHPS